MAPRPAGFAGTSQKQRIRLSEEASVVSALSSTPTGLNPLAYFLPFGSDPDHDEAGSNCREEVEAGAAPSQQPRSKVEFADLCGSLEELVYLGEGSNGVVYSASWHGAHVAVKFMLGNGDDSTHLQRCFTEAVLTRVLSHPCVVQCFATAIAQLTPEVWESINSKNQRHQAILQTTQLGRLCDAATQPPCPTLQPSTSSGRQGLLSAAAATAVSPRACALGAMSHMSGPCTPHECNGSSTSQPQLTDGLSGLTTGCGADASAEMEAAAASRAAAEMRKVASFFAEEEEGAGEAGSSAGGAGDDAQNGEVEGISLLQALTDLQAEAGRHCTVVVMEYMDAGTLHQGIVRGEFSARKNAEHRPKLLSLLLTAQELAQAAIPLASIE
ncbi:hypothetical protein HYH03_019169 [Edaphochlamys debaryana]|uniref:Protein kinase domain-containing protein n=1 Tax=Edaphochlamys debaryana TaxID=47281 RepID=A0A836BMF7_9CHLO|nr:hypothetical protein HYH03_019169 [Edaphochlamys debaryana]|eukprot:KAG2481870.1 hypothetical protein HYH03_019169 [Edaphochlamys debaryana]